MTQKTLTLQHLFFFFLAFYVFRFSWFFWGVFPFFSKGFRGSAKRETLFFGGGGGGFPCFFQKEQGVGRVREVDPKVTFRAPAKVTQK